MKQEILDAKIKELECKFQAMIKNVEAEFFSRYIDNCQIKMDRIYDLLYSRLSEELKIVNGMKVNNSIKSLKDDLSRFEDDLSRFEFDKPKKSKKKNKK